MPGSEGKFDFAIDRGGTFTDVFAQCPGGAERVLKLLSHDPQHYRDAPTEGIRRILEQETGRVFPREEPLDPSLIGWIRMGTTVATNALLERQGARSALLVTRGFKDLLHIGTQARPLLFDLEVRMPELLYDEVIEVDERVVLKQDGCQLPPRDTESTHIGSTGEAVSVWRSVDLVQVEADLRGVLSRGITSLAVLLLHSYTWSVHEEAVGALAERLGFQQVSLSSRVMPMVRAVPRGLTAAADAYLTPRITEYLQGFTEGFRGGLEGVRVLFMQSDGGLTPMAQFSGARAVLSGPAGGVVGYAMTSYSQEDGQPIIGFDMGGQGCLSWDPSQQERTLGRPATGKAKGHDTSRHVLACFGGAGGQHACAIARALGMKTVLIHKYSGVLSAYGLALADVVEEAQEPCACRYETQSFARLDERIEQLTQRCMDALRKHGFSSAQVSCEVFLHLRYDRTDCALMVSARGYPSSAQSCHAGDFRSAFMDRYLKEFGFTIPERPIVVDDIRVRGCGRSGVTTQNMTPNKQGPPRVTTVTQCYFDSGYLDTNVYLLEDLSYDHNITGPALIIDKNSTVLVEPGCEAELTAGGAVRLSVGSGAPWALDTRLDSVQLSIFSHRFMSIAEQMGRVLQRTSISTNIKERLDFSCAVFGPDGGLVSNAPHIPVHLGAMQETVQYQLRALGASLREGDVILSNHPSAGGSHLPDLTVITPVFRPGVAGPVFFVASRGHHADIGGVTPGSMPPHSTSLRQEGAVFTSFRLVTGGQFQEEAVTAALMAPAQYPGCSGTRNLQDNLSDLRAQVAANRRGSQLVGELIDSYGLEVVQAYMGYIQSNAELAVRDMLKEFARRRRQQTGYLQVQAEDHMDDGTPIRLCVQIDEQEGSAVFDFGGTGPEVWGNCNAPRAITLSALIYCLRCMVGQDIPLNQGCLAPVSVLLPPGSILHPSPEAAVVGGNVLTSQRVVDVILRAFGVCAASQGCMNNVSFGGEGWGYYETVAGGAGAGPGWHGRSGVHSHMTNTRITDPEILERRYPVVLQRFSLRGGSGGAGRWRGGDGVLRELLFREPVVLSVLTERRSTRPYGLNGGEPGAPGLNLLRRADGRVINLGAKTSVNLEPGDVFCLHTPGGGGCGEEEGGESGGPRATQQRDPRPFLERGSLYDYRTAQESV
ncbi:5-oxoprolinase isoform X3 [Amia ocellicauda]|uniref:5-oxoprolinase isoform X3 n=1 Tax=Amia ocellicauda TaxID=2972642 RepID=UPI0034647AE8